MQTTHVHEHAASDTAWDDAYLDAYPEVYRGLVARGARPDEAEDALHDAFIRGVHRRDISNAAGWLFIVSLRRWRRLRFRARIFSPLRAVARSPIAHEPERRIDLFDALAKLPPRQREVLVARYVVGLSQEETARALGIARGTVAATTTQAARVLRARLEER